MQFIPGFSIGALSPGIAAKIVPGIRIDTALTLVLAAFLLGLVQADGNGCE